MISLAIALAILNAVIAIMLLTARLIFSSGRDGTWFPKVDRALTSIHPRFGTPWIATLPTGVLSAAACFLDEKFLLVVTGTSLVVVYGALCVAVIAGRRNGTTAHAGYRMPWFPIAPAKDPEIGRPSLYVTDSVVVVAVAYFMLVLRRRGGWRLTGDPADPGSDPDGGGGGADGEEPRSSAIT